MYTAKVDGKLKYESPVVRVVQVGIEKGFAVSDRPDLDENPPKEQHVYTIYNVRNGGVAW